MDDHSDSPILQKTSTLLRAARKRMGFSHDRVAAHLGVSSATLMRMERGEVILAARQWLEFCKLVQISPDSLVEGWVDSLHPVQLQGAPDPGGYELADRYLHHRASKVRTLRPWVSFLRQNLGERDFSGLCLNLGIDEDVFVDFDFQVNLNLILDLMGTASERKLLNPAALADFRKSLIHSGSHGAVFQRWMKAQNSQERLLRLIQSSQHYECNFEYNLHPEGRDSRTQILEVVPADHMSEFALPKGSDLGEFLCRYRKMYFSTLSALSATSRPEVEERECLFKGGKRCVFEFKTPDPHRALKLVS
jgi:transcriptional regulator with XRE-family HTH domain